MAVKGPCFNCTERYIGCHSQCESYITFRNEHDEVQEVIREARQKDTEYWGAATSTPSRWNKTYR